MYKECCHIVGVSAGAKDKDIKKAYRAKAKHLHPDVNPNPNSAKQFIQLQKASEYLLRFNKVAHELHLEDQLDRPEPEVVYYTRKKEPDLLDDPLGRIIYGAFHFILILAGCLIFLYPLYGLIKRGVDDDISFLSAMLSFTFAEVMGVVLVVTFIRSGMKLFKK